jgi:hypothetical protein
MKKKIISIGVAVVLIATLFGTGVFAQPEENLNKSAKATAKVGCLQVMAVAESADGIEGLGSGGPIDLSSGSLGIGIDCAGKVMSQTIKVPEGKDLFIDLALQTGMYTMTEVKSSNKVKDTSAALGAILVQVKIDGETVHPIDPIIFDSRIQVLSAELQGVLGPFNEDGSANITDNETIALTVGTLSAHSFNFIAEDLSSGTHEVEVWALAVAAADSMQGSAEAIALIGLGSMTVEQVRMAKGEVVELQ